MFLSRDDLKKLTGTADRKKQAECLKSNRIPFTLDILNRPVVTISAIEGRAAIKAEEPKQGWNGPSFLRAA